MLKEEIKEVEQLLKNYNDMVSIIELKELEIKDLRRNLLWMWSNMLFRKEWTNI